MDRHVEALLYALDVLKREENKKYIQAIYLYGSCARCEQRYSSDVDILLIVKDMPRKRCIQLKSEIVPEDYTLPVVDLKICEEGIKFSKTFYDNFKKDGKLLWERV